jgi:hypothetical protein
MLEILIYLAKAIIILMFTAAMYLAIGGIIIDIKNRIMLDKIIKREEDKKR